MAKIIGFREDFKRDYVVLGEGQCYEISNLRGLKRGCCLGSTPYYNMVQDGIDWSISTQRELRFFLDDDKYVDFTDDPNGAILFLKDYIANGGEVVEQQPLVFIQEDDEALVI